MLRIRIAAIGAAIVLATVVGAADTRIEFKSTEGADKSAQVILVGHGKVRTDRGTTASTIIDPASKVMILLDHQKREFTRLTVPAVDALAKAPADGRTLADILGPPEDLKMMDMGKTATVAGHACHVAHTTLKGAVLTEQCLADMTVIGLSAADREVLVTALALAQDLLTRLGALPEVSGQSSVLKAGQISLRDTTIINGVRNTTEFVRVRTGPLSASLFTVPATYKEQKLQEGL